MFLFRLSRPSGPGLLFNLVGSAVFAVGFSAAAQAHPSGELRIPAPKPVLTYGELVKETRRLASDRNELVDAVVARRVRVSLKPFGGGSDAFFVDKQDGIGFVCHSKAMGFKGGLVEAMIISHESGADDGDFYTLNQCGGVPQPKTASK